MAENQNFSIQGYNLVTLLKRLEAATSRLEDVTVYQETHTASSVNNGNTVTPAITAHNVSAPVQSNEPLAIKSAAVEEETPKSIKEFDVLIKQYITPYIESSKKIDSVLGEQAETFKEAVQKERDVLLAASKSKKLSLEDQDFQTLVIAPINQLILKVIEIKDDNRQSKVFNFLNAVAEGVAVLGWIVTSTPVSYIPDFKDSAQFWTNRILKDFKGKDNEQEASEWVKNFLTIFDELKSYVKEYQTTGITWSGDKNIKDVLAEKSAPTAVSSNAPSSGSGGPPPPPPPPPPPADLFADDNNNNKSATTNASNEGGMGAVFAELNKGEGITSGLKKVDKSQMTHKNPELRKKSVPMPPKKPKSLSSSSSIKEETKKTSKKPGVKELIDNKWMITNMTKEEIVNGVITIEGSMEQSVYVGNCEEIVIQIKGKVNVISINECTKVGVVIDKAISSVEMTKCKRCEVQVIEEVPIMTIDQSDSTNIYLSESSLNVEIYSSCCTALNINVPEPDGDMSEIAVSEQFVTRFSKDDNGKPKHVTETVKHG